MKINEPLSYYTDDSSLRFYLLNVGEGLMMLIVFPNNKVMLFDCNVTSDNEDKIISLLKSSIPYRDNEETGTTEQIIDVFVNSHRDEDHYRGLKKINKYFPICSIWDSGQTGATTESDDYQYYMGLRRRLKKQNEKNLKELVPSSLPVADFNGVQIYCLSSKENYQEDYNNGQTALREYNKIQHTNSIVLKISYAGRSILLTGDSDWKAWKENIVPNFKCNVKSNILVASHHGSRSFFTDETNSSIDITKNPDTTYLDALKYIDPDITLISCGEYEEYHHPNADAEEQYLHYSKNEQVYNTHVCGCLEGFISSNGTYTVVPERFRNQHYGSSSCHMEIECAYTRKGMQNIVHSGQPLLTGANLEFTVKSSDGLLEPYNAVLVRWEVSNGGKGKDFFHQEIYEKSNEEAGGKYSFQRELCYSGTHLLKCTVCNRAKGVIVTQVFEVIGI